MKRKLFTAFIMLFFACSLVGQELVLIKLNNQEEAGHYIRQKNIDVNYFCDDFIIATAKKPVNESLLIDYTPWEEEENYFVLWMSQTGKSSYTKETNQFADILYTGDNYLVVNVKAANIKKLKPMVHGGIVNIRNIKIQEPRNKNFAKFVDYNPVIAGYISEVNKDTVANNIIHMENYGTRNCYEPQSVLAQDWIKARFESYGLTATLQDFYMSGGESSDNVIAVQEGSVNNQKYVVVGGHYDSMSSPVTDAPGADDNASGTAGVMEVARILSQYQFNYTIVYCAFSGEEYGLYGSAAYASDAASQGMDIMGYLNLDMIGYLNPGDDFHTDMICPSSAQPLADYYNDIVDTYVTDFTVEDGTLIGGDSDHTSFNNNGYMGIFPFEDSDNYSPYIHTPSDIFGTSVNSTDLVEKFVQAGVGFVADMAVPFNGLFPPVNLTAQQNENNVELNWDAPQQTTDFTRYKIYRNSVAIDSIDDVSSTTYTDYSVENSNMYTYYVTAVYGGNNAGESYPSNSVTVEFGRIELYTFDFEESEQGWTIAGNPNGWQWNVTVDIPGNSTPYISIDSDAAGSGPHVFDHAISPELDLSGHNTLSLEFDYGYKDYSNDFFKVLYRTSPSGDWVELENLNEATSFITHSVEIPGNAISETTQFAFYYDDNDDWAWYAAFDNVVISGFENTNQLPPPQNLTYTLNINEVELSWEEPAKAFVKYYIYRNGDIIDSVEDVSINNYTDQEVITGETYTYFVTALYDDGESSPSNQVTVEITGIVANDLKNQVKVFPIPAQEFIKVTCSPKSMNPMGFNYQLINLQGQVMIRGLLTNRNNRIDISILDEGIYFLKLSNKDKTISKKIPVL